MKYKKYNKKKKLSKKQKKLLARDIAEAIIENPIASMLLYAEFLKRKKEKMENGNNSKIGKSKVQD